MANDWNRQVIDEFRANGGVVGGNFAGVPLVILHTAGAKSGEARETPLFYRQDGDDLVVFASYAGAPSHPDWYHNVVANPEVTVEVGDGTRKMRARIADGDERDRLWSAQKVEWPQFAEYEAKTEREIPVVVLEPAA